MDRPAIELADVVLGDRYTPENGRVFLADGAVQGRGGVAGRSLTKTGRGFTGVVGA